MRMVILNLWMILKIRANYVWHGVGPPSVGAISVVMTMIMMKNSVATEHLGKVKRTYGMLICRIRQQGRVCKSGSGGVF